LDEGGMCLRKFSLRPIYEEILNIKYVINEVTFVHVYKERNRTADLLSKEGLQDGS
jgi:hypothetical protein